MNCADLKGGERHHHRRLSQEAPETERSLKPHTWRHGADVFLDQEMVKFGEFKKRWMVGNDLHSVNAHT